MASTAKVIRLRATEQLRDLIDRGAAAVHKSRTESILEASAAAAQNALLDLTYFALSPTKMAEFQRIMERRLTVNPELSALLASHAPWEQSDPPAN